MDASPLTRRAVVRSAWPIIVANSAVPLLGFVDTAVIGHRGRLVDLAAVALGSLIFNFVFWTFGFLRMGTTGFVAQARGRGDHVELRASVGRSLGLGALLGVLLIALQGPLCRLALLLLGGAADVEAVAAEYFFARIWSAPATLGLFAVMGTLIGLGLGRAVLLVQLLLTGLNAILDVLFAGTLAMGARGIGLGTAVSEWVACIVGLVIVARVMPARAASEALFGSRKQLLRTAPLRKAVTSNADILLRTLGLIAGFAYFTDQSARFGSDVLAANHVLLQFISFSAFFLDGFANVAEAQVGDAVGQGQRKVFERAVRVTMELSALTACLLGLAVALLGPWVIDQLTDLPKVSALSHQFLPFAALYVALAFAAFEFDGVFIGATRTRAMRNASIQALGAFLLVSIPLTRAFQNRGLWMAFIVFVVARGVTLGRHYHGLRASIRESA